MTSVASADSVTDAYGGQGTNIPQSSGPQSGGPQVAGVETTQGPTVAGATATRPASSSSPTTGSGTAPVAATAPATAPEQVSGGSLPFTGLDVGLMAFGGALLLGLGVAMRRLTRREAPLA